MFKNLIDLRSSNEALTQCTERYDHLLPPPSPQLRQRMDYMLQPDAPRYPNRKPEWLTSRPCTLTEEQALDRAKGCLLGLSIGDAVGTTLKFLPRDSEHVSDMVGGGPFKLKPGEWTDDTSMALALADTYVANNKFDFRDYTQRLCRWYTNGENSHNGKCFDIGYALSRLMSLCGGWPKALNLPNISNF